MSPPGYSFIVSNYNYEKYLPECLDSILSQGLAPSQFEVVCVDDGSTDQSWELIQSYIARHNNLHAYQIPNSGLEKAVNHGIQQARFDRVIRVDSDDFIDSNYLSIMDQAIQHFPTYDFYYCREYNDYFSPQEILPKSLPPFDKEEIFSRGDFFATGTVYKKKDIQSIGYFNEQVKNCGLENYNVILTLISSEKKGLAVPQASFNYRRHRKNMSTVKREAIIQYGQALMKKFGRSFKTNSNHPYELKI